MDIGGWLYGESLAVNILPRRPIGAGDKTGPLRTRELQEGLPARDIVATIGDIAVEGEGVVRRANVT